MTRRGAVPRPLRTALASPGGSCYRHCDRPIRARAVPSLLPGLLYVRACPLGVVSVTSYAEWTRRNPIASVRRLLRQWSEPPSLVRDRDLRLATRHGPELGHSAERFLSRQRPRRGVRVVYWRVYPFRDRKGAERRLFVCFRRRHPHPVFFAASPTEVPAPCPACARSLRGRRN
ncbi:MAG TPA: hypothetical protein VMH38_01110 [Thermoplasmata archaeon]|nr:hypothetical protein [Thermoplasmata archaeon]